MAWNYLLLFFIIALILCSEGFYKYVYFLSIGYGFAIAGLGITLLVCFGTQMSFTCIILCVLFTVYGARLSGFLLYREIRSSSYRKTLKNDIKADKPVPFGVKAAIWISVSALYTLQVTPVFYRIYNHSNDTVVPLIAAAISLTALILETLADLQKDRQKKENPDHVAMKGLYRIVRCPNYFGEILFWTGIFISGITAYQNAGQWTAAVFAYICIVYIMFNGAQRLEKRQMKRYGSDADYKAYTDRTPIILPFIPLYHLNKEQ